MALRGSEQWPVGDGWQARKGVYAINIPGGLLCPVLFCRCKLTGVLRVVL